MCSLHDSALMCCGLWRCLTQQPESQDLSQRQKIPWRSEDTLWGRSSCEEFCASRHQIASDHHSKEKPVRKHNKPPLSLTSDVAPALDSSEKEKNTQRCQCGMQPLQALCSSGQGNSQAPAFPGKPHNAHNHTLLWLYLCPSNLAGISPGKKFSP